MRRISANYIYTNTGKPLKNGIVELSDSGEIINIVDTQGQLRESRNLEFYNGILVPGFINTHCHLELSEHKGKITNGLGLHNFLEKVFELKKLNNSEETYDSIKLYDKIMKSNGIVAVGDICNTNKTIKTKKESKIYYQNFIEALGHGDAIEIMEKNKNLQSEFINNKLNSSIVPHAPYSVSNLLLELIKENAKQNDSVISIHNQETISENEMFKTRTGFLFNKLSSLGVDFSNWRDTGKNSIESIIDLLPKNNNIIFVHNTYSEEYDINVIDKNIENAYWCLCPLSNKYIENKLPDLKMFINCSDKVTLGTDSLSSNKVLSILEEMKVIQKECDLSFEELLKWATINGAKALKIEERYGSIEKGKVPGLNLISNFDFQSMKIKDNSEVRVLI